MPDAQSYRWEDLPTDHPLETITRRRVIGEHAMISDVTLEEGCTVETHHHANEQFAIVLSGRVRFGLGAEGSAERREIEVGAGEVLHLPPHVPHSAFALEVSRVLDVFSPPSETTGIDEQD